MKKLLFVALCAMFCLGSAAQDESEYAEVADTARMLKPRVAQTDANDKLLNAQISEFSSLLQQLKDMTLNGQDVEDALKVPEDLYVPIKGKSKFTRRHYIYQSLDISPSVSTDNDPDLPDQTSNGKDIDEDQLDSPTGFGFDGGYTLTFVPGREENGKLRLNSMGFAYNVGMTASVSHQEKYGTTCNFLLKLGIEAGNGHAMGIGFDILGGIGKSTGDDYLLVYQEGQEDDLASPYTDWCKQYGFQLLIRSNLLKTAIKGVDMMLFVRMIKSINPDKDTYPKLISDNISLDSYWKEETWKFGVILRYHI